MENDRHREIIDRWSVQLAEETRRIASMLSEAGMRGTVTLKLQVLRSDDSQDPVELTERVTCVNMQVE